MNNVTHLNFDARKREAKAAAFTTLAGLVEYSTEPSRILDLRVERLMNTSAIHDDHLDRHPEAARKFTSSLDAAEQLLPPRTDGDKIFRDTPNAFFAEVKIAPFGEWQTIGRAGPCENRAMALTAACLKTYAWLLLHRPDLLESRPLSKGLSA